MEDLLKSFITIFLGIVFATFLSRECLLQPNIINL